MLPVSVERVPVNREHGFPRAVVVEVVAGCNLRCVMCPQSRLPRPRGVMDLGLFGRLADEIAAADPDTHVWAPLMGEVFTHGDLVFDYVDRARAAGCRRLHLNTNLAAFREESIARLVSSPPDTLVVGLDAATRATYDRIRVGGDFERVERNVEALLAARRSGALRRTEIVLQFIVQEHNAHEEEAFRARWRGRGATLKFRHRLGWGTAVTAPALDIPQERRTMPCPWLMRTMSVHWTGEVAQCDAMWDGREYVGDLRRQSIRDVWNGRLGAMRRRHLANDFDFDPCRTCRDWQCGTSEVVH
jgi:radical SAM protein with 4Fe4S-binding SPASM domain